ncbi:MAG TPA: hypothetical protein PLW68_03840 [Casimicrobiaceae bacterium]|nr:hypothetical protein [Casimicrobiaceae bacterium]
MPPAQSKSVEIPAGRALVGAVLAWALAGGLTNGTAMAASTEASMAAHDSPSVAPVTARNLAALDCREVSAADVAELLPPGRAPRIILFQGSLTAITMEPLGEFLIAMGYPEKQVRDPRDGKLSQSSFGDSLPWAGTLAWYYETEGMMPMLIGHSQGGMMAIRILYELDGAFHKDIPVWNPLTGAALARTTIRDPRAGATRPVRGLKVGFASAIATGRLMRVFLGQWDMISKLRRIPDTAIDFTGFSIPWDPIAGTLADPEPYVAVGTARVRNVILPAGTSHVRVPEVRELASNAVTRAWIDAYSPANGTPPPQVADVDTSNLLHAADIWYSVRRNWCESAQQGAQSEANR